jgi:DNA polymerase I-like protein with 3'-5' exonuclease and polymerase domains
MRAGIVGLAFSTASRDADYVPIGHRGLGGLESVPLAAALDVLRPILEDESIRKVGHDLKFDAVVLARHGVTLRGIDLDTMLASYLVDAPVPDTPSRILRSSTRATRRSPKRISAAQREGRIARRRAGRGRARLRRQSAPTWQASSRRSLGLLASGVLTSTKRWAAASPCYVAIRRAGVPLDVDALKTQSRSSGS